MLSALFLISNIVFGGTDDATDVHIVCPTNQTLKPVTMISTIVKTKFDKMCPASSKFNHFRLRNSETSSGKIVCTVSNHTCLQPTNPKSLGCMCVAVNRTHYILHFNFEINERYGGIWDVVTNCTTTNSSNDILSKDNCILIINPRVSDGLRPSADVAVNGAFLGKFTPFLVVVLQYMCLYLM